MRIRSSTPRYLVVEISFSWPTCKGEEIRKLISFLLFNISASCLQYTCKTKSNYLKIKMIVPEVTIIYEIQNIDRIFSLVLRFNKFTSICYQDYAYVRNYTTIS